MNAVASGFDAKLVAPLNLYAFEPSVERVRYLDRRMRSDLAESVRYLAEQLAPHVDLPEARIAAFLARLKSAPASPLTFALYGDLVLAIDRDDLDEASGLVEQLSVQPEFKGGLEFVRLGDPETDGTADRYRRYLDTDPKMRFQFLSPPEDAAQEFCAKAREALAVLEAADAALSAELQEILREIILAEGSREKGGRTFEGASSPMLWGAAVFNVRRGGDLVKMVQLLAHEAAHNLLFGLCPDVDLMENDPEERHDSPLREDRRPLPGVYHAVYVSARMQQALRAVAAQGLFPPELKARVDGDLALNAKLFKSGMETLNQHARLTPLGAEIMSHAQDFMAKDGSAGLLVR